MMSDSKISISADGSISIEGSDDFVREMLKKHKGHIDNLLLPKSKSGKKTDSGTGAGSTSSSSGKNVSDYANVFDADGEKVHVLPSVPGSGFAVKAVNCALILCYGNKLYKNEDTTPYNDVIDLCKDNACYDHTNFSKIFKNKKNKGCFIISGDGNSKTVKLTKPGIEKAEGLISTLL